MRKNIPLLTHPLALAAGLSALLGCSGNQGRDTALTVPSPPPPPPSGSAAPESPPASPK